ncbi:MAG: Rne/Rng family ribonuclease [Gammaproteobacteria bacterium]|nr:Rne/Rng family ribonuclease [Gammaproteobacteria bacterium]
MSKMLINATNAEELRVAVIEDGKLADFNTQDPEREQKKSNIYKGKVTRLEPSLGAAFVDYGAERHGFLPIKEVSRDYFITTEANNEPISKIKITDVLKEGQEIIVQISKEERGNKGAALTTFISLAGSYLVLMPNNPRAGGVSRRIEGKDRDELRSILSQLKIPEDTGVIVRTAGMGKSIEELQWDLDALLHHSKAIQDAAKERSAPFLILRESDIVTRTLRDHLRPDLTDIIVDDSNIMNKIVDYLNHYRPAFAEHVKLHQDKVPLFSFYKIEQQIETAFQREVRLPSGGSIVIDPTEALISIDVNSSKATAGSNIEETALNTNLEAADEVARQLRLRDIGGLIVIDFIDMMQLQNQREVTNRLRKALSRDRARVRIGNITKFGLMEMSRQRLRPAIYTNIQVPCPRCDGQGTIRSITSLAQSVLRLAEEQASLIGTAQVQIHLPTDLATFILNEKRHVIGEIEARHSIQIIIIPNQFINTPKYKIRRVKTIDLPKGKRDIKSYKLLQPPKFDVPDFRDKNAKESVMEKAAITELRHNKPSPIQKKPLIGSFIGKIKTKLFTPEKPQEETTQKNTQHRRPYYGNKNKSPQKSQTAANRRGSRGGKPRTTTRKQS